ncbi:MAG TPA: formylglycine-generating enzyme family protein [Planctomycetaceae bacterium]|jgi:formylglycine-generating enzyme required for sulfatase activity|nr:formylglycine-generating enzyme family protein [Planctomycetaceae bacterium]
MTNPQPAPPWKHWWIWCLGCIALGGLLLVDYAQRQAAPPAASSIGQDGQSSDGSGLSGGVPSPPVSPNEQSDTRARDPALTTGDSQIDAFLRDELGRWQDEFGFDNDALHAGVQSAIHAFRPFLLFTGGRESISEICREAREEAGRTQRRLGRISRPLGRTGGEETIRGGAFAFNALEQAAADWLQSKTVANVDPQVPEGGWTTPDESAGSRTAEATEIVPRLRASRGNLVNAAGKIVWAARPDLPLTVNSQLAAAFLEWVDEFQLSEEDVPSLARSVLGRLLVLQSGPGGLPAASQARVVACEAGIKWLHEARDEARPLYRRTGWVNVPQLVRLSTEVAARGAAAEANGQFAGEKPLASAKRTSSNFGNGLIQLASAIAGQDRPALLTAPFDQTAARTAQQWWADGLKLPIDPTNSIGMKLVVIPAGEFFMGSTPLQVHQIRRGDPSFRKDWERDEQPQHHVQISRPFLLGAHEVTRGQFGEFVRSTKYVTDAQRDHKGGMGFEAATSEFKQDPHFNWQNAGFVQSDDQPVVNVSWNDAVAFCQWLSRKEKIAYRLPTEAEWEYACRAGTTTLYSYGDDPEGLAAVANVADAAAREKFSSWSGIAGRDGHVFTAPVGSFQPNAFGLFDMHGNVWEWCRDWFGESYYAKSPEKDPSGPPTGTVRVFRGGSWYDAASLCRSAFRYWDVPTYRDYFLGFRVAADLPTQ